MSEKMIINANLIRKESEFRTKSCVVEKAIAVSHAEFDDLKRHPLRDNKLIAENADLMYCDRDDNYHCLLMTTTTISVTHTTAAISRQALCFWIIGARTVL